MDKYGKPYGTCKYDDVYAKKMMFPIEILIVIIINPHGKLCDNNDPYGVYYGKHHLLRMSRMAFHRRPNVRDWIGMKLPCRNKAHF